MPANAITLTLSPRAQCERNLTLHANRNQKDMSRLHINDSREKLTSGILYYTTQQML